MSTILIVGEGGREHALAKAFAKSSHVTKIYVAPGNPGMEDKKIQQISLLGNAIEDLAQFALQEKVDLTFVGPEIPLSMGIVDRFRQLGLKIIGPTQQASQIESSKGFAKDLMQRANIKTATYQRFKGNQKQYAKEFLNTLSAPFVIKQDGLAAGKGVIIADNLAEAYSAIDDLLSTQEDEIVIEQYLEGEEFSYFCFVNEEHVIPLTTARDYKRAYEGDKGLNTGGMGAFSPAVFITSEIEQSVHDEIITPLVKQMNQEGYPYTGILYAGLMKTQDGIYVIEFNARFGDPETQIILPRIQTDFFELCLAHLNQMPITVELSPQKTLGIVVAANGYPQQYSKGMLIESDNLVCLDTICFSGVVFNSKQQMVTSGGRILMVYAQADTLRDCRKLVMKQLEDIHISDTFYRRDIGKSFEEGV